MQKSPPGIIRRKAGKLSNPPPQMSELMIRLYAARGISSANELDLELAALPNPQSLPGTDAAASLLADVLEAGQCILIVGDFDCDGATSCALCVLALKALGAARVEYLVPNRFKYGYGLTPEIVQVALAKKPDLLMTVDNGISSLEGVDFCNQAGIPVIVTDHHLPGRELPKAAALVNPRLPGSEQFTGQNLAGVGVAFYVMAALRAELKSRDWFTRKNIQPPNLADYLDLVALGTVADVVVLDQVNRILVHQGIQRIRAGRGRPGINALIQVAGKQVQKLVAADLGFYVGPRLNAAGRLKDMSQGIECLLTESTTLAMEGAKELDRLNKERRDIEEKMKQQALAELDACQLEEADDMAFGLCLYQQHWHQGVIGILASRIKDQYHRPVIAFAQGEKGILKGSARSVKGLHIRDVLDAIATQNPGLIDKFGGHAMAAGLSLAQHQYAAFTQAFDEEVRKHLNADDLHGVIYSDGSLQAEQLALQTAQQIRDAGPWGQGFPEPLFDGEFMLESSRVVGENHLKMSLTPQPGIIPIDAIAFRQADVINAEEGDKVHVAYKLDINEYRGKINLQLLVEHIRRIE